MFKCEKMCIFELMQYNSISPFMKLFRQKVHHVLVAVNTWVSFIVKYKIFLSQLI